MVRRALSLVLMTLFVFMHSVSWAADIAASAARTQIHLDESVELSFTASGSVDGDPDFSPLNNDFEIAGQSRGSSYSIVNGHVSRQTTWQLTLFPKRTGALVIPAIHFGKDLSNPVHIVVTDSGGGSASSGDRDVSLSVESDPQTTYVQSQVIITVRLYYATDLDNASISQPEFNKDVIMRPLGEARKYSKVISGRDFNVYEQRYAVFPQQAGELTMAPIRVKGTRASGRAFLDPFNMLQQGGIPSQNFRLQSEEVSINVEPKPQSFGGDWLPASNLTLSEEWSEDPSQFKVGEPITRTLRLTATGLTADQLPAIELPAMDESFKAYPDQPTTDDQVLGNSIVGQRQQSVALMPTRPGRYELPEVTVHWWNTRTDQPDTARLPARTIQVVGGAGTDNSPVAPTQSQTRVQDKLQAAEPPGPESFASEQIAAPARQGVNAFWMVLSAVLALGWLLTAVLWWKQSRKQSSALTPAVPDTSSRSAEKSLKRACSANQAEEAKTALLGWGRILWPEQAPASLEALADRLEGELARQIRLLSQHLYGAGSGEWNGSELWQSYSKYDKQRPKSARTSEKGLEPLHRI